MKILDRLSLPSCLFLLLGVSSAPAQAAENDAVKPPAPKESGASTPSRPTSSSNATSRDRGNGITINGAEGNDVSVTKPRDFAYAKTSNLVQGNPIGTDKSGTGAAPRPNSGPGRGTAPRTSSRSGSAPLIVPAIQKIRESSGRIQCAPTPAPPH